jgi:hypothetical protein
MGVVWIIIHRLTAFVHRLLFQIQTGTPIKYSNKSGVKESEPKHGR